MTEYIVYEDTGSGYERLGVFSGSSPEVVKNKVKERQKVRGVTRGIDIYPVNYLTEYFPSHMK